MHDTAFRTLGYHPFNSSLLACYSRWRSEPRRICANAWERSFFQHGFMLSDRVFGCFRHWPTSIFLFICWCKRALSYSHCAIDLPCMRWELKNMVSSPDDCSSDHRIPIMMWASDVHVKDTWVADVLTNCGTRNDVNVTVSQEFAGKIGYVWTVKDVVFLPLQPFSACLLVILNEIENFTRWQE